ncbi:hypothetical protein [Parerythrobacter aestuarii]|uniref:hypothetical protein n=1 Tax=Parerythrobacter aestuarii TaxID=3020909 RepID=UPI0024DE88AA|nr:hypothetical protein [Parerythrobacter aestuarii]
MRKMPSHEASEWLIANYPRDSSELGVAFALLEHLSFKRVDAVALAEHYLRGRVFAHAKPYIVFRKLLGLARFFSVMGRLVPESRRDRELLLYHLGPLLAEAKTDRELAARDECLTRLGAEQLGKGSPVPTDAQQRIS